jgi:hypothetical protein
LVRWNTKGGVLRATKLLQLATKSDFKRCTLITCVQKSAFLQLAAILLLVDGWWTQKVIESNINYYSHFVGEDKILRHCPPCLELRLRMKTAGGSMKSFSAFSVNYCWTFPIKPCVVTWCVNPASKTYSSTYLISSSIEIYFYFRIRF